MMWVIAFLGILAIVLIVVFTKGTSETPEGSDASTEVAKGKWDAAPAQSSVDKLKTLYSGTKPIYISAGVTKNVFDSSMFADPNYRTTVAKYRSLIGWQDGDRNIAATILNNWKSTNAPNARDFPGGRDNDTMYRIMTASTKTEAVNLAIA